MRGLSSVIHYAKRGVSDVGLDAAYALRGLRRRPAFACVAAALLAIALGANTAMFSVVHQILMADLPVREPERLVVLKRSNPEQRDQTGFDFAFFRELDDARDVFDDVLCRAVGSERVTVATDSGGAPAAGELVCGSYFEALGIKPHLGRLIGRVDDVRPGAHPVVVLSHGYWQRQFGGNPSVIDRTVRITGVPMTIIGVLPEEFTGLDPAQGAHLRVPLTMVAEVRAGPAHGRQRPATLDGGSPVIIVGRLRDGVTPEQAAQVITSRWPRYLDERAPARPHGFERVEVEPAASGIGVARRQYQTSLRVLMVATISVLGIACLNLTNLLLVRASARRNEFATRLALGAGPARLVRQLFVESLMLSVAGAALGAALAYPFVELLIQLASAADGPASIAMPKPTSTVMLFHAGTAMTCAVIFGLLPALTLRRFDATFVRERETSPSSALARRVFLVAQVAIAVVVLVGAALFVRTERALRATELGFDAERLLVLALSPQNAGAAPEQTLPFFRAARERVRALPGVSDVTYGWIRPLINATWTTTVSVAGCCPEGVTNASRNAVGPRYFNTLGIPLVAGREFAETDDSAAPKVAVVNETFARMHGNGGNGNGGSANGGSNLLGARIGVTSPDYTIVGIVKDAKYSHLREAPTAVWYVPYEQQPNVKYLDMYIRTTGAPAEMIGSVRAAIASVDPQVALFEVRPLQAQVDRLLVVERMLSALSVFFGSAGAILAGLGLYGMVAWLVTSRAREIGVRLALGATPAAVAVQVTVEAWKSLAIGLIAGTIIAALVGRYVATLLFGVTPLDPVSFAAGVLMLVVLVTLAAAVPMRRASRADPMIVLRDG
jgi:predicted permease